jgi:hypothetical protein
MARIPFEDFSEKEIARIYIAQNIKEATRIEEVLTQKGIEYAIELESYWQVTLFSSEHVGAAFYVPFGQVDCCRAMLEAAGLSAGLVE